MGTPPGGCTSQDTVKVFGIELEVTKSLTATSGATAVVVVGRLGSIECLGKLLRDDDGTVHGSVAPVDLLLLFVQGP